MEKLEKLLRQAKLTFSTKLYKTNQAPEEGSLNKLKSLADQISASDVKFDNFLLVPDEEKATTLGPPPMKSSKEPPVTYMEIFEDTTVTLGVFILKPGVKIPLHDHPNMHGILKVIAGTVKIQCYNLKNNTPTVQTDLVPLLSTTLATKLPEIIVGEKDAACVLTPTDRNLHEIESIEGAAAFLDILTPPYESTFLNKENQCNYYEEMPHTNDFEGSDTVRLRCIPSPPEFWSNTAPYLGPPLRDIFGIVSD